MRISTAKIKPTGPKHPKSRTLTRSKSFRRSADMKQHFAKKKRWTGAIGKARRQSSITEADAGMLAVRGRLAAVATAEGDSRTSVSYGRFLVKGANRTPGF